VFGKVRFWEDRKKHTEEVPATTKVMGFLSLTDFIISIKRGIINHAPRPACAPNLAQLRSQALSGKRNKSQKQGVK